MKSSKGYNGHKNRSHWNIALWIGNDESLYNMARFEIRTAANRVEAAHNILDRLRQAGVESTPDGYRFNYTNIRAAIVGM